MNFSQLYNRYKIHFLKFIQYFKLTSINNHPGCVSKWVYPNERENSQKRLRFILETIEFSNDGNSVNADFENAYSFPIHKLNADSEAPQGDPIQWI